MASSSAGPTANASIKELKTVMYARCSQAPPEKLFSQHDLLAMGFIPGDSLDILQQCVQRLVNERLFRVHQGADGIVWKLVKKEDADRYQSMNTDEAMVFSYIESSGREGIWSRTIKQRTNIHQSVMTRSIKALESRGFIKSIKSVRYPTRIYYMLSNLTPSEDVTGGPWFTDGELDTDFVEVLCTQIELYISSRTFFQPPSTSSSSTSGSKRPLKTIKSAPLRDPMTELRAPDSASTPGVASRPRPREKLLQYPPDYQGYPTLGDIMAWLNKSHISAVPLAEEHVKQLLDLLYYDRRIERVQAGTMYRSVRQADSGALDNGLTEAPCGRCPVFALCEEGGPVNASNCEYFKEWLEI